MRYACITYRVMQASAGGKIRKIIAGLSDYSFEIIGINACNKINMPVGETALLGRPRGRLGLDMMIGRCSRHSSQIEQFATVAIQPNLLEQFANRVSGNRCTRIVLTDKTTVVVSRHSDSCYRWLYDPESSDRHEFVILSSEWYRIMQEPGRG